MNLLGCISRFLLFSMLLGLFMPRVVPASVPDDSNLFMEAFNAYQKKDYLYVIEKTDQLNKLFPDTPLRDLSLLFMARAGYRAGDNELAAKAINQFLSEFADNNLRASVEEELIELGSQLKKGEKLLPNKQLYSSALKVRNDQLAKDRAIALKIEQERLAKEKAEMERVAREKAEAERREMERIAAEKISKESIKLAISVPDNQVLEVGKDGVLPLELANKGKKREKFQVSLSGASDYATIQKQADPSGGLLESVTLDPGESLKAYLNVRVPAGKIDGFKMQIPLRAVSDKYSDVMFVAEAHITAAAPLIRAIIKPSSQSVSGEGSFKYRIAILNAGSVAAQNLSVRVMLPQQLELSDAGGNEYIVEGGGITAFKIEALETGYMKEINLQVRVKGHVDVKQEIRCKVEVANGNLQVKEVFSSTPTILYGK